MFVVVRKKTVIIATVLIVVIATLSVLVGSESVAASAKNTRLLPIYSVQTDEKKVALTFDAAWGADKTEQIMDELEKYGYKGTFFLVGFWIDKYPEMVKEIHERGHLIGNHSTNHLHMSKLSEAEIKEEISVTSSKIAAITDYTPQYFRAPYGEYNNRLINYTIENGIQTIQWDVDTLDWKGLSAGQIAERVLNNAKNGSIILCHNNSDHIVEALPLILLGLKNKGYTVVRLDELVLKDHYTVDASGKQIPDVRAS
jgi:polysaccharide deacetylase family sporulation protein PdaB